jgi:uncharacterized protein YbjT (DUF2867 family)
MKTAIVLGATGLVGREIVSLLEADDDVSRVVLLTRRAPDRPVAAKTEVRITDFREPASFARGLEADALFSALGTTIRAAGSKEAQYEVDYTFQYEVARAARAAGVPAIALVSSLGADATSSMFYSRIKGELERDVIALGFPRTRILRPSILDGERRESRPGEAIGMFFMRGLGKVPGIAKYRPIPVRTVAAAAIALVRDEAPGVVITESTELFERAGR